MSKEMRLMFKSILFQNDTLKYICNHPDWILNDEQVSQLKEDIKTHELPWMTILVLCNLKDYFQTKDKLEIYINNEYLRKTSRNTFIKDEIPMMEV